MSPGHFVLARQCAVFLGALIMGNRIGVYTQFVLVC